MSSLNNIKQLLANYSQASVRDISLSKLGNKYLPEVERRKAQDLANEQELSLSIPHIERVKRLIAEELEQISQEENAHLPVTSVFDALQAVKADRNVERDAGLRALRGQLEKMWKKDRTASISSSSYQALTEHYKRNYPKSVVVDTLQKIGAAGYMTLEVSKLASIAEDIRSQEDYEQAILRHGLQGNSPNNVKARKFILAMVNGDSKRPFERTAQDFKKRKPEILANVGDVNYIDYGGLVVVDRGYGPEGWYIRPPDANPHLEYKEWEVYQFPLDKIEADSSWVGKNLKSIASTIGSTEEEVRGWLASDNLTERALGYDAIIGWGGADEFDNAQQYNAREIHELFGEDYEEPESEEDEEEDFGEDEEDSGIKLSRKAQFEDEDGEEFGEEEEEFQGPEDEDYVISSGRGAGYNVGVQGGKFLGSGDWDECISLIFSDMKNGQHWPNVWEISDHGNVRLVDMSKEEKAEEFDSEWGRFDSPLAKKLHEYAMESGEDDSVGDASEGAGWAGLFKAEKAILYIDTQGFISVDEFDDEASLMKHWEHLEAELNYDPFGEGEDEEDEEDEGEEPAEEADPRQLDLKFSKKSGASAELQRIKEIINENRENGRFQYDGLDSSEIDKIDKYDRSVMFGDDDEAFPDEEEWSRIVD